MNCESGTHNFRPFKRSRDLFCSECGTVRSYNNWPSTGGVSRPAVHAAEDPAPTKNDPYIDDAREIIEKNNFEKLVVKILDENGANGPLRDQLYAEAMSFGPALPLEQWFDHVQESVEKLHVETPLDELIDGIFAE